MAPKKKVHRFQFHGYDQDDNGIISDYDGYELEPVDNPPDFSGEEPEIAVYRKNPTWIRIGGRWYCIGC